MKPSFPLLLLLLGLLGFAVLPMHGYSPAYPPAPFHFATYRSQSGKFVLEVDPSSPSGLGQSDCRLLSDGKEVWAKRFSFTLRKAEVTEHGGVAGYGYTAPGPLSFGSPGELRIVILDEKGELLLDEAHPCRASGLPGDSWTPSGENVLLFPEVNRAIFYVGGLPVSWLSYDLATGKKIAEFEIDFIKLAGADLLSNDGHVMIREARVLAGHPFMLLHLEMVKDWRHRGAVFAIVDLEGKAIWKKAFPTAYSVPNDPVAAQKLASQLWGRNMILDTGRAGSFEVWHPKEKKRGRYTITEKNGKWLVREAGLQPYTPPPVYPEVPAAPVPLQRLGEFALADRPAANPLDGIFDWDIDGKGQIGFLKWSKASCSFRLLDSTGKLLWEIPEVYKAPAENSGGEIHLACTGESTWIVTLSPDYAGQSKAWRIDTGTKTKTPLAAFKSPYVLSLAGLPDGGFVALTDAQREEWTGYGLGIQNHTSLRAFDRTGRLRWKTKDVSPGNQGELSYFVKFVTVTSKGEIAVLDGFRPGLMKLLDTGGKFLRQFDLDKAVGQKLNPLSITADREGGFLVNSFSDSDRLFRLAGDGKIRGQLRPTYPSGLLANPAFGLRFAPDGAVWFCDGHAFFTLNAAHQATPRIGLAPNSDVLETIVDAGADAQGRVYAVDKRTGTVHVYDGEGHKLRVSKPILEDFGKDYDQGFDFQITVAANGAFFLHNYAQKAKVCFDPEGARIGKKGPIDAERYSEDWFPRGSLDDLVVDGFDFAKLVDGTGKEVKKLERAAGRRWLGYVSNGAAAGDKSFALQHSNETRDVEQYVTFFSAAGLPQKTLQLPNRPLELIGYNGTHAVLRNELEIFFVHRESGAIQTAALPADRVFLTREGREVWAMDFAARKITRYALPEGK